MEYSVPGREGDRYSSQQASEGCKKFPTPAGVAGLYRHISLLFPIELFSCLHVSAEEFSVVFGAASLLENGGSHEDKK